MNMKRETKEMLSKVMSTAWKIAKKRKVMFKTALRQAWLIVKNSLKAIVCEAVGDTGSGKVRSYIKEYGGRFDWDQKKWIFAKLPSELGLDTLRAWGIRLVEVK